MQMQLVMQDFPHLHLNHSKTYTEFVIRIITLLQQHHRLHIPTMQACQLATSVPSTIQVHISAHILNRILSLARTRTRTRMQTQIQTQTITKLNSLSIRYLK
jgi:hypothetical protein